MPRLLLPILLALLCLPLQAEPRLATLEYPPYSSSGLEGGGSIVELTRRAFASQGYQPQIDFLPWARVRAELRAGTYQGALALWPQEIKEEQLIASRPLFYSQLGLFARQQDPVRFSSLADLRGLKVGIVRGYGYPPRLLTSGLITEEAVDDISNLRKLAARRFDLVLLERIVGEHLIANDSELRGRLVWQEPALERIPLVVGFTSHREGEPDWAAIFERGLRELHGSGEYTRILKRYAAPPFAQ
ncbi:substrate-binding periplasmic protein [Pseudomonas sp. zbq_18]|uniref:substrate-binding periplasmic protein n=1 Tax=Pseudomonas sp. zbq_18 TaxID=3367251 RepID=UPI00370B940E